MEKVIKDFGYEFTPYSGFTPNISKYGNGFYPSSYQKVSETISNNKKGIKNV